MVKPATLPPPFGVPTIPCATLQAAKVPALATSGPVGSRPGLQVAVAVATTGRIAPVGAVVEGLASGRPEARPSATSGQADATLLASVAVDLRH